MKTDTSERGLEDLIVTAMTGRATIAPAPQGEMEETAESARGTGWLLGEPRDYDREYCVDLVPLRAFLEATQPEVAAALELGSDTPVRRKFLARVESELSRKGVIHVLRHGLKHEKYTLELFYGTPSPGNEKAAALFAANRFGVTRQFRYSRDETKRALAGC